MRSETIRLVPFFCFPRLLSKAINNASEKGAGANSDRFRGGVQLFKGRESEGRGAGVRGTRDGGQRDGGRGRLAAHPSQIIRDSEPVSVSNNVSLST